MWSTRASLSRLMCCRPLRCCPARRSPRLRHDVAAHAPVQVMGRVQAGCSNVIQPETHAWLAEQYSFFQRCLISSLTLLNTVYILWHKLQLRRLAAATSQAEAPHRCRALLPSLPIQSVATAPLAHWQPAVTYLFPTNTCSSGHDRNRDRQSTQGNGGSSCAGGCKDLLVADGKQQ